MKHQDQTDSAIYVLTSRDIEATLEDGGSQAWVLDAKRASKFKYVVCVKNDKGPDFDETLQAPIPNRTAFLVGKLECVVPSIYERRWLLRFSEYAEINIPDAWPGFRNPVWYCDLQKLKIEPDSLEFQPMPNKQSAVKKPPQPLTIAQAKAGLALGFGVTPADIEITIRG